MTTLETPAIEVGADRRRIAVMRRSGDAPGLLWLGGYRSDMTGTKAAALDAFGERSGRAVTRFDYSGHGASGGAFEDGTISRWAEDAKAVFDRLTTGPQVLVGSSMGGWIALLLARAHLAEVGRAASRIAGLVLIAPAPDFTEELMWPAMDAAARHALETTGRYLEPSIYASEPNVITRALIEDGRRNLVFGAPIEPGCPVAILQGMADPDVPWRHAMRLVEHLPADDVTLTLVKDGDHRLSRDADITLLIETVERTLLSAARS